MDSQLLALLFLLALTHTTLCVRRPEYLSRARILGPKEKTESSNSTRHDPAIGPMTSSKCCKTGEKIAKEGMYCSFDIHAVARTPNYVHRTKLKMYGEEQTPTHVRSYKNLALRIAKCFHHKLIFEKCCNHRANFLLAMKQCREKGDTATKKECRKRTRNKYGY